MEILKNQKTVLTIVTGVIIVVALMVVGSLVNSKIAAEKEVAQAKIEAEKSVKQTELNEKESTNRSGEWSQIFQKMIPWGEYEGE